MLPSALTDTWPWYVAGPLIGLFVPLLQLLGGKQLGLSGNLRHLCAALLPRRPAFLQYDWKSTGVWNLLFAFGTAIGGWIGIHLLGTGEIALSPTAQTALHQLGLTDLSGLVPRELFSWPALLTLRGFVSVVVGGFLVGFGAAYAGGCTSSHAISGLSNFQLRSLLAVLGFFAGGLFATHLLLPLLF